MQDLEDMTREQLLGQIMRLRKENGRLKEQVSNMAWERDGIAWVVLACGIGLMNGGILTDETYSD
jgi:hypothetical protein